MASSDTEICNLALSHLGVGKEIANLETEKSQEASACRRMYSIALDQTLREFDWPFARKIAALNLVEEDPNDEWAYSYRIPTDCVAFRRVFSGIRNDSRSTRTPTEIGQDTTGLILLTDKEDAVGRYTKRVTNVQLYPPDFVMALSLRIAFLVAPRVAGGDPFKVGDAAMKNYMVEIEKARINSIREEQDDELPESEFIRERE
jgi:hypothetical protein